MSGSAVTDVLSPVHTSKDIQQIMGFVIPIVIAKVLLLTTNSWFEPVLFMITIGIAIILNMGTNLIFGEISFVTNAAGSVLQLAVSMDYSIFLLHRFSENRSQGKNVQEAMIAAVKTVDRFGYVERSYNGNRFCGADPDAFQNLDRIWAGLWQRRSH